MAAGLQPTAFTILDKAGIDTLELIGRSRMRHEEHIPSADELDRMLAASRARHRSLSAECLEYKKPKTSWSASKLKELKKKKLREKDRIESLLTLMRRSGADAFELGSGYYGNVLLGRSKQLGKVAIKVVPHDAGHSSTSALAREAEVLTALQGEPGFPRLHYHGRQDVLGENSDVLVMQLLGQSLDDLCWESEGGTHFSAQLIPRIGRELLRRLRTLHEAGYVHNDLKPSNVLLGARGSADEASRTLHLVDFGISTRAGEVLEEPNAVPLGTPLFASAAAHAGRVTRPVDDIESLCYCLAWLAQGRLPWERGGADAMKTSMLNTGALAGEGMSTATAGSGDAGGGGGVLDSAGVQALWEEVAACNASPERAVDYEACAEALGGDGGPAFDLK